MTGAGAPAGEGHAIARVPWLVIGALALAIMLPELLFGTPFSDSYFYNVVWVDQFAREFANGNVYPRWLPRSWDGMGSPAFYFYSPLYFFVAAIVRTLTAFLSAGASMALATGVVLGASGTTMFLWLRTTVSPKAAQFAALAYMAMPYHVHDIYNRGALAEATAYAVLPLIPLALARVGRHELRGVALLAVAFAALILAHMPSAVLGSVFVIAPLVGWHALKSGRPDMRFVVMAAAGGLIGFGLASVFMLPALKLLPTIANEALWPAFYRPENWFFFSGSHSLLGEKIDWVTLSSAMLCLGYGTIAIAGALAVRRRGGDAGVLFWSAMAVFAIVMLSGVVPAFWRIPGLREVQFTYRTFVPLEFITVSILAWTATAINRKVFIAVGLLLAMSYTLIVNGVVVHLTPPHAFGETYHNVRRQSLRAYQDAPEYLPRGVNLPPDEAGRADPGKWVKPAVPLVAVDSAAATVIGRPRSEANGDILVEIAATAPTQVVARRYAFPRWVVETGAGESIAASRVADGRVAWIASPGRHQYRLTGAPTAPERVGALISLASLIVLAGLMLFARRRPNREI